MQASGARDIRALVYFFLTPWVRFWLLYGITDRFRLRAAPVSHASVRVGHMSSFLEPLISNTNSHMRTHTHLKVVV